MKAFIYKKIKILPQALAAVLTLLIVPQTPIVFAQQVMSGTDYAIQSDSINFGGTLSSSPSYSLEDTLGEVGTGNISGAAFSAEIGYQAMLIAGDTTPPSAPTITSAAALSSSRIEISWTESTDNVAVTRYYIYRDGVRVSDVPLFPRSYVDTGLSPNTIYTYNVSAVDDAGNESSLSNTASAQTLGGVQQGGAPSILIYNLSIIPGENFALVTFDTNTELFSGIAWGMDANYSTGTIAPGSAVKSHSFYIPNLKPGTSYLLKINLTRQDGFTSSFEGIQFVTAQFPSVITPPTTLDFQAQAEENGITLSWTLPKEPPVASIKILRSTEFYPSVPEEGELIFEGTGTDFFDSNVEKGVRYYYTLFTKDIFGNTSTGVVSSAIILLPGQEEPPYLPEELELSGEVDPMIEALTIDDFLFIQEGKILEAANSRVTIDGSKNLTVALRAYKVPPLLKTIAVTLGTQEEDPKYFTFILRMNKDKTRYEAVVAPLGETNSYNLKITVVDFKNQGLKKIEGSMLVLSQAAWSGIGMENKQVFLYVLLVLLLVVLAAYLIVKFLRKDSEQPA